MKIKPLENNKLQSYNDARFNENTQGLCNSIKNGNKNTEKSDYSALVLVSIMYEKGYLKHELVKESFNDAASFVEEYERNQ